MEHSFLCVFEFFFFSTLIHGSDEVPSKPIVILNPSNRLISSGDTIMLTCQIQGDGGTQWTYEWRPEYLNNQGKNSKTIFLKVTESDSGEYSCRGIKDTFTSEWSDVITLTVYPQPVLTVSPSWLSPGASVTLSCEVKHPSAGWRFYWYKAVPQPSTNSSIYELLPGSTSGTEQDSYIIDGQTHTAGYACRTGRGDPVIYTPYSQTTMVWSADSHPSASFSVSPDRVQHFTSDSVSLNCEENSSEWRVRELKERGVLSSVCFNMKTKTGSSCETSGKSSERAVYWCESESGQFSNAVNITFQSGDIILVSPVHPVTEGASVSLSCRLRRQNQLSSVFFYHNDKLIQNDSREELNISPVSQSDEGFYKCQHSGNDSPQSWMSVKTVSRSENSSFPVLLIVGPVSVLLPILLLLLLCCCRQSKGAADETIGSSEITGTDAHESQDVTYSQIQIKRKTGQKRGHHEPEEDVVYSNVLTRTSGQHHKPKEGAIYSDLKTITAGRVSYNNSTPVDDDIN